MCIFSRDLFLRELDPRLAAAGTSVGLFLYINLAFGDSLNWRLPQLFASDTAANCVTLLHKAHHFILETHNLSKHWPTFFHANETWGLFHSNGDDKIKGDRLKAESGYSRILPALKGWQIDRIGYIWQPISWSIQMQKSDDAKFLACKMSRLKQWKFDGLQLFFFRI